MRLLAYNAKPAAKFQGQDDYYLGVELELFAPDMTKRNEGLAKQKRPGCMYAKHDGSIPYTGWELVTHPIARKLWLEATPPAARTTESTITRTYMGMTYTAKQVAAGWQINGGATYPTMRAASHACTNGKRGVLFTPSAGGEGGNGNAARKFLRLVADLKAMGYESHNGGQCGLHIHVSKTAFSGMTENNLRCTHYFWFKKIINSPLFAKLSQRDDFGFCHQTPVTIQDFADNHWGRYQAVNPTRHTIEVRIFRGNMIEARIRKAVEAVIAAVEWAEDRSMRQLTDAQDVGDAYATWVRANRATYPNLANYLDRIDAPTANETEA